MKTLLFLLTMLPMILSTSCFRAGEDLGNKHLRRITVQEHEYKFGVVETDGRILEDYEYDSKGRLIKEEKNGDTSIYIYDNNNRIVERNDYGSMLLDYKAFYSYNSIDSISKIIIYDDDGDLHETQTYEYDDVTRRLTKATVIDSWMAGDFGYIYNYTYSGYNITETKYFFRDQSLSGITLYEYDSHGNQTGNTWTNGKTGEETRQKEIVYEYNSKDQISKKTSWTMSPDHSTYMEYTYNEDGTIHKIHVSYSNKADQADLIYQYVRAG